MAAGKLHLEHGPCQNRTDRAFHFNGFRFTILFPDVVLLKSRTSTSSTSASAASSSSSSSWRSCDNFPLVSFCANTSLRPFKMTPFLPVDNRKICHQREKSPILRGFRGTPSLPLLDLLSAQVPGLEPIFLSSCHRWEKHCPHFTLKSRRSNRNLPQHTWNSIF